MPPIRHNNIFRANTARDIDRLSVEDTPRIENKATYAPSRMPNPAIDIGSKAIIDMLGISPRNHIYGICIPREIAMA